MVVIRKYWRYILLCFFSFIIIFSATVGFVLANITKAHNSIARSVLLSMYEFETLEDLVNQYNYISSFVTNEVWREISPEGDSRVINYYYRFQTRSTKVNIIKEEPGLILYTFENDYIMPDRIFAFEYVVSRGKISEIREYELVGKSWGVEGVLNTE